MFTMDGFTLRMLLLDFVYHLLSIGCILVPSEQVCIVDMVHHHGLRFLTLTN